LNITPYECYTLYLALKQHFSKEEYDFFRYNGKIRTSTTTYNKRNDRYFFEKLSRKYNKQELIEYFVASFIQENQPSKLWIGDLREKGEDTYSQWKARVQALSYRFQEELKNLTCDNHLFECIQYEEQKHPLVVKKYLREEISIETLFILDDVLHFIKESDYDPILKSINFKVKKYRPFFEYDKKYFIEIIRDVIK
jgi:hypothetical protein